MANAGSINYEFTASVANLEQQAVVAQKIIEDKIGKQIDSIGTKSTVSDKKIVGMMKNIAREGRAVSPMLGKIGVAIAGIDAVVVPLYRSFETFFARMMPKIEAFGMAILSGLSNPLVGAGIIIAGVVVAGVALYSFFDATAEHAAKAKKDLTAFNDEMERANSLALQAQVAALMKGSNLDFLAAQIKEQETKRDAAIKHMTDTKFQLRPGGEGESMQPGLIEATLRGKYEPKLPPAEPGWFSAAYWNDTKLEDPGQKTTDAIIKSGIEAQKSLDALMAKQSVLQAFEKDIAEDAAANAAAAAKAAADAIRAQEAQGKAAEAAAAKELAGQERLEAQAKAKAQAAAERAAAEQEQHEARLNMVELEKAQVQQSQYAFYDWAASLQANMADVYQGIQSLATMATQGIGDAFARTIVYGESLSEAMDALWKQMAASLISMIIQVALQQLVALAVELLAFAAGVSAEIAGKMALGVVGAMAQAYAWCPWPANLAAGPAAGKMALASMTALGATGMAAGRALGATAAIPGAASGALVTGDMLMRVGEGGQDELIAPRSDYERLIDSARGERSLHIYLDSQELTRSVAKELPRELRKHGVR